MDAVDLRRCSEITVRHPRLPLWRTDTAHLDESEVLAPEGALDGLGRLIRAATQLQASGLPQNALGGAREAQPTEQIEPFADVAELIVGQVE